MAKVTGPLFSFGASGSVAGKLTFRANDRYFVAQRPPIPTGAPSSWQLLERQSMRNAAAAWASLSNNDRAIWGNSSVATIRSAWMSFFLEWKTQRVHAGALPLIPAQYIGTPTRLPFPAPYVPTNHGAMLGHYAAANWMHSTANAGQRGALRAHGHADSHALATLPSQDRGALRGHGAADSRALATLPGQDRGALRGHHGAGRAADATAPSQQRGALRARTTNEARALMAPPSRQRGALRAHGARGRLRRQ